MTIRITLHVYVHSDKCIYLSTLYNLNYYYYYKIGTSCDIILIVLLLYKLYYTTYIVGSLKRLV